MTISFKFEKDIENFLKIISKNAQNQKVRVFFVGGIVRDALLNKKTQDLDLIIEGNAINFAQNLPENIKIKSIHEDFGTVKLNYNNIEIDIASTREESYPYSGCLPKVEKIGVSIKEDVKRRDFSVNSLYAEIIENNNKLDYKLIDLVNGTEDINSKTLKVLHSNSYIDDPTRILRGLNFKYRFNFDFSDNDKLLIKKYLKKINYKNASYDRILAVFRHILSREFGDIIFKEIIKNQYYKILDKTDLIVDLDRINSIIEKFSLKNKEKTEFYLDIIQNREIEKNNFEKEIDYYKFLNKENKSYCAYYCYKFNDEKLIKYIKTINIKLYVTGDDLIKLNYPKVKLYSEIFDNLLSNKLINPENFQTKNDEILWIKNNYPI